ncbi:MAG: hypothetical protein ACFCUX_00205 [Candidatus Methylacidiphilales bacterium]
MNTTPADSVPLLASQLERMRGMQYHYHHKFFMCLGVSSLIFLLLWLGGGKAGSLWIPFLVITAGVQASFYLHFCDFARTHAVHLERLLNRHYSQRLLMGGEIEDLYFYPLGEPKLSGLLPLRPLRFFSMFTLHWCVLWMAVSVAAWLHGSTILNGTERVLYVTGWLIWGGGNALFLIWYFAAKPDLRAIDEHLMERLGRTEGADEVPV